MEKPANVKLFEAVVVAINEADPIGLLKMGCPLDEYEHEAKMFCETVAEEVDKEGKIATPAWCVDCIHGIFVRQFDSGTDYDGKPIVSRHDMTGSKKKYLDLGKKLYDLLLEDIVA